MNSITPRKTHHTPGPRRPLLSHLASSSLLCLLGFHSALHAENARLADSFVDSIGVNTHFGHWTDTGNQIKTKLGASGIRYIRDNGATDTTMSLLYSSYGIKTLLTFDGGGLSLANRVTSLGQDYMIGLQGRNEPDTPNFPNITWDGVTDNKAILTFMGTRAYQYELYNTAKASTTAKLKPIISPPFNNANNNATLAPLPFDKISYHAYPDAGDKPGWWRLKIECIPDAAKMVASGQSPQGMWVTETGYHTGYSGSTSYANAITHTATGKYIPRILATNFSQKIERTFLYEFWDETNDNSSEGSFGLITNNYTPKSSYWAVKNLITLLQDPDDPSTEFSPGALNYTLTTTPSNPNVKSILLQKQNREYYLLLWQEVVSCNPGVAPSTPPTDKTITAANVNVNLGTLVTSVTKYTGLSGSSLPAGATVATTTSSNQSIINNLSVPDEIIILKIILPLGVNPASGAPAPAAGSDLVITKVWSEPANPIAGEPTRFHITMKNKGTAAITATTKVRFASGPSPIVPDITALAFPAGGSQTLETDSITTLAAGFNIIRVNCDSTSAVTETDESNNMSTLTVPVLTNRYTFPCNTTAGWTSFSPNWVSQTVGARSFLTNTAPDMSGGLKYTFNPTITSNWRLDFEYNWLAGGIPNSCGATDLSVLASVYNTAGLSGAGSGYRIKVRQGDSNLPLDKPKQIELFKITNGVESFLAAGEGYDECGDSTSTQFKVISLIYDRATKSLSAYADLNADGVLEQVIAPVRDTTSNPPTSFAELVLQASSGQGPVGAQPKFDNVVFSHGVTTLVPAPFFTDSFDEDFAQWPSHPNWTASTIGGQTYVHNTLNYAPGTMTHPFVAPLTNGWSLGFDYDFEWAGGTAGGNQYGSNDVTVTAAMLDANNNGYRIVVQQGDSGTAANNNKVIKIFKVSAGGNGPQPLAQGIGYNRPGWHDLLAPKFKRVILTYNRKMQTLSAFIDLNGDGTMEQVIGPVQDTTTTTTTSFTQLQLGGSTGGQGAVTPAFDNIEVGLIQ